MMYGIRLYILTCLIFSFLSPITYAQQAGCESKVMSGQEDASHKFRAGLITQVSPVKDYWTHFDFTLLQFGRPRYTLSLLRADEQLIALATTDTKTLVLQPTFMCLCLHSDHEVNLTFAIKHIGSELVVSWFGYENVLDLLDVRISSTDFVRVTNLGDNDMSVAFCNPDETSNATFVTAEKHRGQRCPRCRAEGKEEAYSNYALIISLTIFLVALAWTTACAIGIRYQNKRARPIKFTAGTGQGISLQEMAPHRKPTPPSVQSKPSENTSKMSTFQTPRTSEMYSDISQGNMAIQGYPIPNFYKGETEEDDGYLQVNEVKLQSSCQNVAEQEDEESLYENPESMDESTIYYKNMKYA